jgi:hypothetical protein
MQEQDTFIHKLLDNPNKAEALSWLKDGGEDSFRNLGELDTTEESIALVQHLYDLGAVEVLAVEIDTYPEGQNTGKLVITLPDTSEARKKIFAWSSEQAESLGFAPDKDVGQKQLFVGLD